MIKFVFFGSDEYAVLVLDELEKNGLTPSLVITSIDKPVGRKLVVTPPPVKTWAQERNISVLQPEKLDDDFLTCLQTYDWELFVVAFYSKIIPQKILDLPKFGALNIHPSLLPKLRGPSPTKTAILQENETGVTIIRLDNEMDHGPIVAQEKIDIPWPPYNVDLQRTLTLEGARLLIRVLPDYLSGAIVPQPQNDILATYSKKITKADGQIDPFDLMAAEQNLRKIRAFVPWPRAYFFIRRHGKDIRIIITKAHLQDGALVIESVIPEGGKETPWLDFQNGLRD